MADKARPLTTVEKRTAKDAYEAISYAIQGKTGLVRLLGESLKDSTADFRSADIGRWHVIDAFVKGHRGEIPVQHLHRHYRGFMFGVIAGAGFREECPDFDMTTIYDLATKVEEQRQAWRARA